VSTERPSFGAVDGFQVRERACALGSGQLQPLGPLIRHRNDRSSAGAPARLGLLSFL